jgi:ABC-type nitrate/sulfonate/bicarbonate transport system substrate-binding protein
MTKLRAARAAVLLAVMAALLLTGCGSSDDASKSSLRVGYGFGTDGGDTGDLLAYENLEKEGVAVRVSSTGSPENAVAALHRGSIDIAVLNQGTMIQAISQGAPLEAIVAQNMTSESSLAARGVDSIEQLEGTRVAVGRGHGGMALVDLATAAAGLPPGSIGVRSVPESAARATGLQQGRLKSAELDASDTLRLKVSLPDLAVLARLSDYERVTGQLVFVTRPDLAEKQPALLQEFVDGILGASSTLYGPEGRAAFIRVAQANALKGDTDDLVGKTYDYYRSVGMWPRASQPITAAQYQRTQKFFKDTGQIEADVPFERAWNLAFWKAG